MKSDSKRIMYSLWVCVAMMLMPYAYGQAEAATEDTSIATISRPYPDMPMYLRCANPITINLLNGTSSTPVYTSNTGTIITRDGQLYLIPDPKKASLVRYRADITVTVDGRSQTFIFRLAWVPQPTVETFQNGKQVSPGDGLFCKDGMELRVVPEPNFSKACPLDASYDLTDSEFYLLRDGEAVWTKEAATAKIKSFCKGVKDGDRFVIKIGAIHRQTALDESRPVKDQKQYRVFMIKS